MKFKYACNSEISDPIEFVYNGIEITVIVNSIFKLFTTFSMNKVKVIVRKI